jgi:hypothetical protein
MKTIKQPQDEAAVTAFFIPKLETAGKEAERVYAGFRQEAQAHVGHPPQPQRIFKLGFRHEGVDVEAEVGKPHPISGDTVLAILDLGRHSPYLIHCSTRTGSATQVLVSKPVYEVTQFGS